MSKTGWTAPPLVDAHAHIFTRDLPLAPGAWTRPAYDHRVEDFVATLDAHGVAFGVIAAISLFDDDNAYVLDALARYGDRLRATASLPPTTDARTLQRMADAGIIGVRLQWRNSTDLPDPADDLHEGFFRRLADGGLHVELLARGADLPRLLPPIADSGVQLVIDHLGDPDESANAAPGFAAMLRAVENGRTLVKLSATRRIPFERAATVTARLIEVAGPDRLVWGSDAPFVGHEGTAYAEVLDTFARLVPDPAVRHAMGLTALKHWFWWRPSKEGRCR